MTRTRPTHQGHPLVALSVLLLGVLTSGCSGRAEADARGRHSDAMRDLSLCDALPGANVITGTHEDDELVGTDGPDCILGLGGDDVLRGLGGNDLLIGDKGDDVLEAGTGYDSLDGGEGNDVLRGDATRDLLLSGTGADRVQTVPEGQLASR